MKGLALPNITQAQIASAVTWVVAQIVAWGWVSNDQGQIVLAASSSFIAFAWIVGDSIIRHGRNQARGMAIAAGKADPAYADKNSPKAH